MSSAQLGVCSGNALPLTTPCNVPTMRCHLGLGFITYAFDNALCMGLQRDVESFLHFHVFLHKIFQNVLLNAKQQNGHQFVWNRNIGSKTNSTLVRKCQPKFVVQMALLISSKLQISSNFRSVYKCRWSLISSKKQISSNFR